MTFKAEALAGKSKEPQIVYAFKVRDLETPGESTWIPIQKLTLIA